MQAEVSFNVGKDIEQKNIQNQIDKVTGEVINIADGENIVINSVPDLVDGYLKLLDAYTTLGNNSLIAIDGNSTCTIDGCTIIGYGNDVYNEINSNTKELPNINPTSEIFMDGQAGDPIIVSYQLNSTQLQKECRNFLVSAVTSFPADFVIISVVSDEDEEEQQISFNMYGTANNWYMYINLGINKTYKITITAIDDEKKAIYKTTADIYKI